jgi:hypothetical protein
MLSRIHRRSLLKAIVVIALLATLRPAPPQAIAYNGFHRPPGLSAAPDQLFDFHSGFWLNLHHFLYQEALKRSNAPGRGRGDAPASDEPSTSLSGAERQPWDAAIDYYAKNLVKRDLLFDQGLVIVNDHLAKMPDASELRAPGFEPELASVLRQSAPVYRKHWWPSHDAANHKWILSMEPQLKQMGPELADRLSGIYQVEWPKGPDGSAGGIRVEVACYANWAGAYTVSHPGLITISSLDDRNFGDSGLEILFHESSHILDWKVEDEISKICKANNLPEPAGLDHVIVFYTAGEVTRIALAKRGDSSYIPYANKYGLYTRAPHWKEYYRAVLQCWQPYLDAKVSFDNALISLVKTASADGR